MEKWWSGIEIIMERWNDGTKIKTKEFRNNGRVEESEDGKMNNGIRKN